MKIIIREPRQGKTTEIIRLAAEGFYYIVCLNYDQADYIVSEAKKMDLDIPHPITFQAFLKGNFSTNGIKGFIIDDADMLLQRLCRGIKLESITITDLKKND